MAGPLPAPIASHVHEIVSLIRQVLKKHGIFHVPYRGTMIGAALGGGRELARNPLGPGETMDSRLEKKVGRGHEGCFSYFCLAYARVQTCIQMTPSLVEE